VQSLKVEAQFKTDIVNKLPWYTWVLPFPIFFISSLVSLFFKFDTGVGSFYLPTAAAVILVNWWGPKRTLPSLYISSVILTPFWGVEAAWQWFIYPLCETSYAALSWLFFTKLAKGKYWLPNTRNFLLFIFLGLLIPLLVDLLALQSLLSIFGEQPVEQFGNQFLRNWLGEFTANLGICSPVLFSVTRFLQRGNLLLRPPKYMLPSPKYDYKRIEPIAIYVLLIIASVTIPFDKYWFLFGLGGLFIAIRIGFGEALFCNLLIFLITYAIPALYLPDAYFESSNMNVIFNIFLGNILLAVFVAITGRVISDLRYAEDKMQSQFEQLQQTNQELDRFAYSVSHDLSAPLKSIQGLVNISRMDPAAEQKQLYIDKIGQSVTKLDLFIKEILDYSRNKRLPSQFEHVDLKKVSEEVMNDLQYMDDHGRMQVDFSSLENQTIRTDPSRLKIILNNLFSNAIKFQKQFGFEQPCLKVVKSLGNGTITLLVSDNGLGIKPDVREKVFDMFFRGTSHAPGSGLGLYIARETVLKMGGTISVESEFEKGTTFVITLPNG
jgi:two-component system, sensor histidine kinase